jgi:hypothetical protein
MQHLGISYPTLIKELKYLLDKEWITFTGYKSVYTDGGKQKTKCYIINDIWDKNYQYYLSKGVKNRNTLTDKGVKNRNQGGKKSKTNNIPFNNIHNNIYNKKSSIKCLTEEVCKKISDKYQVLLPYVIGKKEDLILYCQANGKKYKNYEAALMKWIRKDISDGKAPKMSIKTTDEIKLQDSELSEEQRKKNIKALNLEKKKLLSQGFKFNN